MGIKAQASRNINKRNMITEDYVSFEAAKLLKEKGFDCACKVWYAEYTSVWGGDPSGDRKYINIQFDDKNMSDDSYKFLCYAPTLQMAMKWLREVHHLTIDVFHFRNWKVNIKTIPDDYFKADYSYPELKPAETYEQACEAAIKYCLENLI